MRNGVHQKKARAVPVGKARISSKGKAKISLRNSRVPAKFAFPKLDRQKTLAIGAVALLILGIAIGTGGKRQQKGQLSAVVNSGETAEEHPAGATSGDLTLKVCVGDTLEEMSLEEYILRVVAAEMPASYDLEALKAQAVAARTYTLRKKLGGGCQKIAGAEICSDHTHCQAYCSPEQMKEKWGKDYEKYRDKMQQAVAQTAGQVLVYEGQPISALYFSSSGGMTEDSKHVFGGNVPYLKSVSSPGESEYEGAQTKKEFSYADFAAKVAEQYPKANVTAENARAVVAIASRYESGRVETLKLGETTISGVKARQLFSLRSANFTISFGAEKLTFETVGYGHGVGMSQSGANAMGKDGNSYEQILTHYYTGVAFGKVQDFIS